MVKKRIIESITATDSKSRRWKSLFSAARLAFETGDLRQAESLLARARELANEIPEHSFAVHSCEIGAGAILLAKAKYRDASSRLQKSLNALESHQDNAHKELLAVALRFNAQALLGMGDANEAEKTLKKSAEILEEIGVDGAVQLSYTLCELSSLYLVQGRLSEAQKYINTAMEILFSTHGPESAEYTRADMIYAVCLFGEEEAQSTTADAIGKLEYVFGKNHPFIARALDRYIKVLNEKGQTAKVEAVKERFCVKAGKK